MTHINTKVVISIISIFVTFGSLHAASFDCKKAGTFIEHTICGEAKLSKLDEELARAYKKAKNNTDKDALKKEQRQWIKTKRKSCKDVQCLRKVYAERVDELNAYSESSGNATWAGNYSHDKSNATIDINKNLTFRYSSVTARGNICDFEGKFVQERDTLVYKSRSEYMNCSMKVISTNDKTINISGGCTYGSCGMGSDINNGKYKK
ncbi:lysozyme inhibitor LprI family protein [Sulfurovum sp. CS9]|uniref:lysozyme inhibitor LprI family protein n=1 Tax=Sulfurovum sp. CS9 TaxID=3391146 RepID=UPI0039E81904